MNITLDSKSIVCHAPDLQAFNDWWIDTTKTILMQGRFLYKVMIDGQTFYDGYEVYIVNNFQKIKSMDLLTKSKEEAMQESMSELHAYNRKLLDASDLVSSAFYGEPSPEQWQLFSQYIEGLHWVSQTVHFIQAIVTENKQYARLEGYLSEVLLQIDDKTKMLNEAAEEKNYVLMGDIIQYEISDTLYKIDEVIGEFR